MGSDKPRKSCFNCTKRRIVCDLTDPTCKKCEKKGLECPGYGIRYRFTDGQTAAPSTIEPAAGSASSTSRRRRSKLKWVDVSNPAKRKRRTQRLDPSRDAEPSSSLTAEGACSVKETQEHTSEEAGGTEPLDGGDLTEASLFGALSGDLEDPVLGRPDSTESFGDDSVIEVIRDDHFIGPVVSDWSIMLYNLPPLLSSPDPKMRLLFNHFSLHVSPVMLMYDDEANGYRHQILPLAHSDPVLERAVCVAAAFHLSQRMPELRLPAENGRAAIIRKLSQTSFDLSDRTWATIVLLIVAELITGHEHVIELYKMLVAFLDARRQSQDQLGMKEESTLGEFLHYQSRVITFFSHPTIGESRAVSDFSNVLQDPLGVFEQFAPHRDPSLQFRVTTTGEKAVVNARTQLYLDIVREGTEIYVLRAGTGNNGPSSSSAISGEVPETDTDSAGDTLAHRIAHIRSLFEQVDPSAPGSHTLVWPAFVAAAESRMLEDRQFFSAILRRIWESTGYANVLRGLDGLPQIWDGQARGERWTAVLPSLKTIVM